MPKTKICEICKTEFIPGPGSRGRGCSAECGQIIAGAARTKFVLSKAEERKTQYYLNPKHCKQCASIIPYEKKLNNFCDGSCATTFTNNERAKLKPKKVKIIKPKKIKKVKAKKVKVEKAKNFSNKFMWKTYIAGPYTKMYHCSCKHCSIKFISKSIFQYCDLHRNMYKRSRNQYEFTFNVYAYPDLFDLSLIEKFGWYSPGNRKEKNNNGIVRDHKISVNESVKNGYDPFYIRHPLNCELLRQEENKKKYTKSSMTYEELVLAVNLYDSIKPESTEIESDPVHHKTHNLADCR
jgi:hypothetical protein